MAVAPQKRTFFLGEWIDAMSGGAKLIRGYQSHMAVQIGTSQPQLSNMISGRKVPQDPEVLLNLSELLGTTVNDLFKMPPPEPYLARLRPYSRFYDLYVTGTTKTDLGASKGQRRRRA